MNSHAQPEPRPAPPRVGASRVPALWMAAAFSSGILFAGVRHGGIHAWALSSAVCLLAGFLLLRMKRHGAAGAAALLAWAFLGAFAANLEKAAVPPNDVTRLVEADSAAFDEPLRWQGILRADPEHFPWGWRYEIELEQVEIQGCRVGVSGGLRMNFYSKREAAQPVAVRAGDRIAALVKAHPPRNFEDPGAPDARAFLARQGVHMTGTLRDAELLERLPGPPPRWAQRMARVRGALLDHLDELFRSSPGRNAVLRAMLLGDRGFVDSDLATEFQSTSTYHVLVLAGLHVAALAIFLLWLCRRLRLSPGISTLVTLLALAAYAGIVQDRPPILRAALMAAIYLCARLLFRRVDLLNTVALAALALLFWKPSSLEDPSFQLSFVAVGALAGLGLPWIERSGEPYLAGLRHLGDVTRDGGHSARVTQFRMDARAAAQWLEPRMPRFLAARSTTLVAAPLRAGLRLWELVLVSLAVQWGMVPVLALYFHRVSLAGPFSNIPAVALLGVIVPLGFATLGSVFFWRRGALLLAKPLGWLTGLLLAVVHWFSRVPRVSYRIPEPPRWVLLGFFAALVLLAWQLRRARPLRRTFAPRHVPPAKGRAGTWIAAAALAVFTLVVVTHPFAPRFAKGMLEMTVLDVGQGSCGLVTFPDGRTLLIDGGGLPGSESLNGYHAGIDVGEEVVSPYLWSRGIKALDTVLLTHADHDHVGGLFAVLDNFRVGQLWVGADQDRPESQRLVALARRRKIAVVPTTQGFDFNWAGVKGEVLWPADSPLARSSHNEASVVLRLTDGDISWLLTGDIESRVERELGEEHQPVRADFLEVPHHGSKSSSSDEFLDAVAPRFAAVSAGLDNPFGHPSPSVVQRYKNRGVRLFRTDSDGAITFVTDGHSLAAATFRGIPDR